MFSKGTRLLVGDEARDFRGVINKLIITVEDAGFSEVILPSIAPVDIWENRSGKEISEQMWTFLDKGGRNTCLVPEGTALLQQMYRGYWSKSLPKPIKVYYTMRAFRYERPQAGRYREFTQFGVEILGPDPESYEEECKSLLQKCLDEIEVPYEFDDDVTRGLSYYTRQGFEARSASLGAQQQIAGGGSYDEGCGWAIGVDRVVIAKKG